MQEDIHRLTDGFIVRHPRDAHDASVTVKAKRAVLFVSSWPDCPDSAPVLPSPGPCVQQLDEILLRRRFCRSGNQWLQLGFHAFFRENIQCRRARSSTKFSEDPLTPLPPPLGGGLKSRSWRTACGTPGRVSR